MSQDLKTLQHDLDVAQDTLSQALASMYPEGRQVLVKLSANQQQPTRGVVMSHGTGRWAGWVMIRLETPKSQVRDFHWSQIR